jgi:hypothetical protein
MSAAFEELEAYLETRQNNHFGFVGFRIEVYKIRARSLD